MCWPDAGAPALPGRCCGAILPIARRFKTLPGPSAPARPLRRTSPPPGGFTFAEDPALDCACVLPIWAGRLDPCVLRARPVQPGSLSAPLWLEVAARDCHWALGSDAAHLAFACAGEIARIDLEVAAPPAGGLLLQFEVLADGRLEHQLAAIRRLFGRGCNRADPRRLMRQHLSLLAVDAHAEGASLREIADYVLGPGDWPGAGEHRKSQVRRLIEAGRRLLVGGAVSAFS